MRFVARERLQIGMVRGSLRGGPRSVGALVVEVNDILPESSWYADCWEEMIN